MIVAVFSSEDHFWLAKVSTPPHVVSERYFDKNSSESFNKNEYVLKVYYFERVSNLPQHVRTFEYRKDLGEHTVAVKMLRAGGTADPIRPMLSKMANEDNEDDEEEDDDEVLLYQQKQNIYTMSQVGDDHIMFKIKNEFKDTLDNTE